MVNITESAAEKVKGLLQNKGEEMALRIFLKSGG